MTVLKCPFCGKDDIEFRLALCATCHADIEYGIEGLDVDQSIEKEINDLFAEADRLEKKSDGQPLIFAYFTAKKAMSVLEKTTELLDKQMSDLKNRTAEKYVAGDYMAKAIFARDDRSFTVTKYIPSTSD